ncbi:MAG: HutD family protein [Ramlibacter sp.]
MVSLADVRPQPWKNGGGTTRMLLAWPSPADWRVRLSVAEVASDGPFSCFDGVQRCFAVLSGAGVRLDVGGVLHTLTAASEPLVFDGAVAVGCTLMDGATLDFNLMARGGSPTLRRVRGAWQGPAGATGFVALYAHQSWTTATFDHETVKIPPATLAWRVADLAAPVAVHSSDALWMEVMP